MLGLGDLVYYSFKKKKAKQLEGYQNIPAIHKSTAIPGQSAWGTFRPWPLGVGDASCSPLPLGPLCLSLRILLGLSFQTSVCSQFSTQLAEKSQIRLWHPFPQALAAAEPESKSEAGLLHPAPGNCWPGRTQIPVSGSDKKMENTVFALESFLHIDKHAVKITVKAPYGSEWGLRSG